VPAPIRASRLVASTSWTPDSEHHDGGAIAPGEARVDATDHRGAAAERDARPAAVATHLEHARNLGSITRPGDKVGRPRVVVGEPGDQIGKRSAARAHRPIARRLGREVGKRCGNADAGHGELGHAMIVSRR
jgi:hypothetical protein